MFSIHDFIVATIRGMVGRYPDFQVREYALNWYGRGKLTENDLAVIEAWLLPAPAEEPEEPETAEEPGEE